MASPQVQQLIQQGAQALKANNKALAKSLLMQATELDERSETAWLYLSAAVDSLEEQQICLENVLAINPTNERARKGLAIIQQKLGKSAAPPPAPPPPPSPAHPSNPTFTSVDWGSSPAAPSAPSGRGVPAPQEYDDWINNLGVGKKASPPASDPWGGNTVTPTSAPHQSTSPFALDSNDPWASLLSDNSAYASAMQSPPPAAPSPASFNQEDAWGSVTSPATASYGASSKLFSDDPAPTASWSEVNTGSSPSAFSGFEPGSSGRTFIREDEPANQSPTYTASPRYAAPSAAPQRTSFDFDEPVEEDSFGLSANTYSAKLYGSFEDDEFSADNFEGDFTFSTSLADDQSDPFASLAPSEATNYYQYIPPELQVAPSGGKGGLLLMVGVLGLLNLAAMGGLVLALLG